MSQKIRSTTVIAVRKDGKIVMAGDGQVTMGETVMKGNARKVRKIYDGKIITGFAGATADAFTLLEKFEIRVKEFSGDLTRAAVELAKDWRTDKMLKNLQALLLVADSKTTLLISGNGDVIDGRRCACNRLRRQLCLCFGFGFDAKHKPFRP